jgi:glutamate synthase domain-containing protein 2
MEGGAMTSEGNGARPLMQESYFYSREVIEDIQAKAALGRYRIRGFGTLRKLPGFDDLTFVTSGLSRVPLEGYREKCSTETVLGSRYASEPMRLETPITITGMSYGALSRNAKVALGKAATRVGISTCTGDGGMLDAEREASRLLVYQVLPSRYGFDPDHLRMADALEVVIGQGAKPGTGGVLLGQKVSEEIANQRDLPPGIDQRSPVRHPDWMGVDDLIIKLEELREATDGRVPVYVKVGAGRVTDDVKLAAKAGADVIFVDGMEAGTGASPEMQLDHTGIPTMAALVEAVAALEDIDLKDEVQLIIAGGIRGGADIAKALALGADAVAIGTAALIALNCNRPIYVEDYKALGAEPGKCHHCHTGMCPVGITTQDPDLMARLDVDEAADRVTRYLNALTMEVQLVARACGKWNVHDLEPEDLRALTMDASFITGIPMVGSNKVPAGQ